MTEKKEFKAPEIIDVDPSELKEVSSMDESKAVDVGYMSEIESENNSESIKVMEPKEDIAADIFIKTVTPYKITFNKKNDKEVATVMFLCRDDFDKLFIIDRNIIVKDEDHRAELECIPFAEDNEFDFVNSKICTNLLLGNLDNYICDMKFSIPKENIKDVNPIMSVKLTNVKTKEDILANINADTFVALSFIDSYIHENIINEHDLALAVIAGSKEKDDKMVEFFVVDSIDKIIAMAPAFVELKPKKSLFEKIQSFILGDEENDHPTSVGIVLKVSRFIGNEKEIVQLLTPFDIGVEFEEEKFKGDTISSIEENYYGDSDQYVTTLTINSIEIGGVDKTYMIIRAKAKTGAIKLFLLDYSIQKELQEKINEY